MIEMTRITITKSSDKEYLYHNVTMAPHQLVIASRLEDTGSDDDIVDPYLFDPSYTLAAATGKFDCFSVWEGAVTLLSFLHSSDTPEAIEFRRRVLEAREKVLELGSGTGVGGIGVAALGGDVLMTDVESVCDITRNNVRRNQQSGANHGGSCSSRGSSTVDSYNWSNTVSIGLGTASVQTLDWSIPVSEQQKPHDPTSSSIIIAAEVAWLEELVPCFVQTLSDLLRPSPSQRAGTEKVCYWAYKERGTEASKIFTTMSHVMRIFHDLGCEVKEIWREPSREDPGKHVIVNIVRFLENSP
ncbi:hypothetical protein DFJ77DRAFT_437780 [Powellomyces hirtus]|nr:hypothetical protein DFJ77DRAFT_437780 [Powellomyces hirtus]